MAATRRPLAPSPSLPAPGKAHLLGEVLDNAVLRHLGANGKAALELLLDAAQHLLVLLAGEALHSCGQKGDGWVGQGAGEAWRDGGLYPKEERLEADPEEKMRRRGIECQGSESPTEETSKET